MSTKLRRIALACLLFGWLALHPRAAEADPLTLDEVLDAVGRTHPELEGAEQKVTAAQAKRLAAAGGFDPLLMVRGRWMPIGYYDNGQVDASVQQATPLWGLSAFAGYRIGLGSYPVYKGELQTLSAGELRAGINLPVWRDGPIDGRRAKIQRADIRQTQAARALDATQLAVERDAAKAYWTWVAAGHRLRVARELLTIAEQRGQALVEQAEAGAIEDIKLVDNQRLVLDRRAKVVTAERKFAQAAVDLSLYLRDDAQRPVRVEDDRLPPVFPEPSAIDADALDRAITRALEQRPDLAVLEAERDAVDVDVRLTRNRRAPAVNLQAFVAKDFGVGPVELEPVEFGAGVTIEIPLGLRTARGDYRAAKAERGQVDAELRAKRDAVEAEVRAAHLALIAAHANVDLARGQVDAARELAEAERERLRQGASDLLALNLRELAVADAANLEIDALADYQRALAEFLVASGIRPTP